MATLAEKRDKILARETLFANRVSAVVIEKPTLSLWMILIPVIFVHFFYRLNKYSQGRKDFARQFLLSRERSLNESLEALESGRKPDTNKIRQMATIPEGTSQTYVKWLKIMVDHYSDLLACKGESYEDMVRSVYKNRTNYLLFLNSLGEAEKAFDNALKPHLKKDTNGVNDIVNTIEVCTTQLRREEASKIFP